MTYLFLLSRSVLIAVILGMVECYTVKGLFRVRLNSWLIIIAVFTTGIVADLLILPREMIMIHFSDKFKPGETGYAVLALTTVFAVLSFVAYLPVKIPFYYFALSKEERTKTKALKYALTGNAVSCLIIFLGMLIYYLFEIQK